MLSLPLRKSRPLYCNNQLCKTLPHSDHWGGKARRAGQLSYLCVTCKRFYPIDAPYIRNKNGYIRCPCCQGRVRYRSRSRQASILRDKQEKNGLIRRI